MTTDDSQTPSSLKDFVEVCTKAASSNFLDEDIVDDIAPAMKSLCRPDNVGHWLPKHMLSSDVEAPPASDGPLMRLLHEEPDGIAIYVCTSQGQTQYPIHSYDTWAVVGVIQGKERLCLYARSDDRLKPDFAILNEASSRVYSHVFDFPVMCLLQGDIWHTYNVEQTPAITVHVYGRNLKRVERRVFNAEERTVVTHKPEEA